MANKEEIKEAEEEVAKYAELEGVANSQGGKKLIESLRSDVKASVEGLCGRYMELTHIEMITLTARLNERLKLLRELTTALKKKKSAKDRLKELVDILQE